MSLDTSQLTLPQMAAAVAAGELRLAEVEAEMKRRPTNEPPRWRRMAPPPRPPAPSPAEVVRQLELTRREIQKANRNLGQLTRRFEALVELASRLELTPPAPAAHKSGRAQPRNQRALAIEAEQHEPDQDAREDEHHVAA